MRDKPKVIDCKEAAKKLNVTEQYVRYLIEQEVISATKVGNTWAISASSIDKYIKKNKNSRYIPDHERGSDDLPGIVALSFFSGAMGLDIGMRNGGIPALLACEFNKACRETIYTNDSNIALIGDVNKCEK